MFGGMIGGAAAAGGGTGTGAGAALMAGVGGRMMPALLRLAKRAMGLGGCDVAGTCGVACWGAGDRMAAGSAGGGGCGVDT